MSDAEKAARLTEHISVCVKCTAAKKRVNDFCATGRMLFAEWNPEPVRAELLSEEDSRQVIAQAERERKKAGGN